MTPKTAKRKTSKRKSTKRKKTSTQSDPPAVRVRMFRQGLGDCFLVTFDVGGDERHMLIDCGTLGNKVSDVKTDDIVKHLKTTILKDARLDVVVATHEHQDHLSAFRTKAMKAIVGKVDHVWLAWTENPSDPDAKTLAKYRDDLGKALAEIAAASPDSEVGKQVHDLMGFAGEPSEDPLAFAKTVNEAMEFVRSGLGVKPTYHDQGALIEADWLPGFRIYVLGPPRDKELLKDLGKHGSDELYGLMRAAKLHAATAERPLSVADQEASELEQPFDSRFRLRGEERKRELYPGYSDDENRWRSVDGGWLNAATHFALQLDSLTNNTSLALAIERVADGKVLLFPADAQQGNWLSWHAPDLHWSVTDGDGTTRKVTAADLLSRTVFYKVGHHASHNATARGQGLELMANEDELTAFIPVDRELALGRNPKGSWQMPARPLYLRLLQKCQGRVVRADTGWAAKAKPGDKIEEALIHLADDPQWTAWKKSQTAAKHVQTDNKLFVEYTLS
ncbi:MBL fold metallo-hydrolase [Rhodopirellula sp. JC639]|uniref:MBL fold metallo-hydrolase n=1 Tax=Stieleria mannarensis TaxID=2755585 RepID=UPI0015FEFEB3